MRFLLDTHMVLWVTTRTDWLPSGAADIVQDQDNALVFSVVSIWEVAIKYALRREDFNAEPGALRHGLLDAGYEELPVIGAHATAVAHLPRIHRDPFDRLLVAQAMVEGLTLLTADPVLAQYPAAVRLV